MPLPVMGACGVPLRRLMGRVDVNVHHQNITTKLVRPTIFKAKCSARINASFAGTPVPFGTAPKGVLSVVRSASLLTESNNAEVEAEADGIGNDSVFNWRQNWYPIAFIQDVPIGMPYKFRLFDEPMVVFMKEEEDLSPSCFVDRCPHRRAPLSEGALTEDGDVMCAYHGWRFDKEGTCTLIPQIGKGDTSSRACATALPCAVHQNMLWVWPTPLAAGETPPSRDLIPGIPGEEGNTLGRVWMRDFENDFPLLLENILDPDHAEFAHASPLIFQDFTFLPDQPRRKITKKFFPEQDGSDTPSEIPCRVEFSQAYKDTDTDVSITWKAPCYVEWRRPPSHPMKGVIGFWVVPTGVGRSRFFIRTVPGFSKKVPDWLYHTFMNNFTDQDSGLLAAQGPFMMGAEAANPGAKGLRRESYTVRSQSDQVLQAVGSFLDATLGDLPNRSRFLKSVGGATELAQSLPSIPGVSGGRRSTVLDRRSTHVDNCVACQTAVKKFTAIDKILSAAAAFCGVAALMLGAALVGSTAASLTAAAAATPGLVEVVKVHVHKGILAAAVLAAATATACLVGAAKARGMLENINGYVYKRSKLQKDLQKIPGVRQSPIDLKAPIPSSE